MHRSEPSPTDVLWFVFLWLGRAGGRVGRRAGGLLWLRWRLRLLPGRMLPRAMRAPRLPTVHPPAQKAEKLQEDQHQKPEEEEAEDPSDKAKGMPPPAMRAIAALVSEIGRQRFGAVPTPGGQAKEKTFIPPRLADHPGDGAKGEDADEGGNFLNCSNIFASLGKGQHELPALGLCAADCLSDCRVYR